jgi:hypothetical protein
VLPIVQSSTTRQVSVANLTAGRAVSATQLTLTTGNLIVASGQGIDFSATPGTGTSELLADYEEGNWTPTLNATGFSGATYSTQVGKYTKTGNIVTVTCEITLSALTSGGGNYLRIEGLPYAIGTKSTSAVYSASLILGTPGNIIFGVCFAGQTAINFFEVSANGDVTPTGMQGSRLTTTSSFVATVSYPV